MKTLISKDTDGRLICVTVMSEFNESEVVAGDILVDSLPADFSVNTYTIKDGLLVPASAELIAIREAAALIASREAVRVAREARYESEPIKSLYWSWIESGLEADRALWIAAKNAIRTELPYPEESAAV